MDQNRKSVEVNLTYHVNLCMKIRTQKETSRSIIKDDPTLLKQSIQETDQILEWPQILKSPANQIRKQQLLGVLSQKDQTYIYSLN